MPERIMEKESILQTAREYKSELLAQMAPVGAFAAREAAEDVAGALDALPQNVLGVGYGAKQTSGAGIFDQLAVRVYVRAKVPRSALSRAEEVPSKVNGTPTDVIAVGDIAALARPAMCGVSVGHHAITAGTLGCLVTRRGPGTGAQYILSNNHVLANSNQAAVGDAILEPGPMDGGDPHDPIAHLTEFEPISFSGPNEVDAAIAEVVELGHVLPEIAVIGRVRTPAVPPALYQSVRKHGRTTRHTLGMIMDVAADIRVRFDRQVASFEDQIAVQGLQGDFSLGGDSGSLIVDAVNSSPVGLLFAGGGGTTFANRISWVLDRFDIDII